MKPDTKPLNGFKEYVRLGRSQNTAFSKDMEAAIELMDLMDKNGGSLKLYKSIKVAHEALRSGECGFTGGTAEAFVGEVPSWSISAS